MPAEPTKNPPLTEDEVRTLGRLAKLSLDDAAVRRLRSELGGVLDRAACLMSADLEGVEPMARPIEEANRLDDDEPGPTLPIGAVERIAPQLEDGFIRVPKVLGGGGGGA